MLLVLVLSMEKGVAEEAIALSQLVNRNKKGWKHRSSIQSGNST